MRKWFFREFMLSTLFLPFIYMLFGPFDQDWFINLILFLILAVGFRQGFVDPKHRTIYITLQFVSVAIMGALISPWSLSMGFYPAIVMGMLPSKRHITRMIVLMVTCYTIAIYFYYQMADVSWRFEWAPIVIALMVIPYVSKAVQHSIEVSARLRDANDEIARLVKNQERQRIARDLHDTLGHTLSMITLKSELVERLIVSNPEGAKEEAQSIQHISRTALRQVRDLVSDMQAVEIKEEIRRAEDILQSSGIQFINHGTHESMTATPIVRNILGMCLRECVTNVIKHSRAVTCTLDLYESSGKYVLAVQDDGIGITFDQTSLDQYGNGLFGMKERLLLIGGKLDVNGCNGIGTKITISVPKVEKPQVEEEKSR